MAKMRDMTEGRPAGQLLAFALPIFFSLMFQQLYSIVDSVIIGRFIGSGALAAIGATSTLDWLILGVAFNLTQGFSILMSRCFGAKDFGQLRRCAAMAAMLCAGVSAVLCVGCTLGTRALLCWTRTPEDILPQACTYLRIIFLCAPVMVFNNLASSVLRALGDSRTPMLAMTLAAGVNIALDLWFVAVLGMGVAGAAIATELANGASLAVCLLAVRRVGFLRLERKDWQVDLGTVRALLKAGVPLAVQNVITASGGLIVQTAVNGFGSAFVAGYTTGRKIMGLMEPVGSALGYTAMTFAGQNLGAGKPKRIRAGMRACLLMAVGGAVVLSAVVLLLRGPLTALFLPGAVGEAAQTAQDYLGVLCATMWLLYLLMLYRSAVQGLGVAGALVAGGVMEFVIRAVLVGPLGQSGGRLLIYTVECFAWVLTGGMMAAVYYRTLRKLEKRSAEKASPPDM